MSNISFNNAVATLKDGETINEDGLRSTVVYAKLMLKAGKKFTTVKSVKDFLLSSKGEHIKAELFYINNRGNMVIDNRLWLSVDKSAKILKNESSKMFYVELIHPTVDLSESVEAF